MGIDFQTKLDAWPIQYLLIGWPLVLLTLYFSIIAIRKDHARHISVLWGLFFFTLCFTAGLLIYAFDNNLIPVFIKPEDYTPVQSAMSYFLGATTNVGEELKLVGILLAVTVVPQSLSFIVSGIYGCGSPPAYISEFTYFCLIRVCPHCVGHGRSDSLWFGGGRWRSSFG